MPGPAPDLAEVARELAGAINAELSAILRGVLSGADPRYRTPKLGSPYADAYRIRWDVVEHALHAAVCRHVGAEPPPAPPPYRPPRPPAPRGD